MTDSSSFSSLLALVDSHLSKTSLQSQPGGTSLGSHFPNPLHTRKNGDQSDTMLSFAPSQRIIPILAFGSSIDGVLETQVSNMLKAQEQKRKQEEEQRLIKETEKLSIKEDPVNGIIDLMQALQPSHKPEPKNETPISNASSLDCLFVPDFSEFDEEETSVETPEPLLPIQTDMSYILRQKIRKGRGSSFGKVLTSRLKPVAAPYLMEDVKTTVVRFKFDTPSPCDLIKEKLRKPSSYNTYNFNIFDMI